MNFPIPVSLDNDYELNIGFILSSCLFNLYKENVMRNAKLEAIKKQQPQMIPL